MSFEPLSYRYTFKINGVPDRWIPLIHLYDPDLPLFPIYYFHAVPKSRWSERPETRNRIYGYVESVFHESGDVLQVRIVTNKDLTLEEMDHFREAAINEVTERIGVTDPVTVNDLRDTFPENSASVLEEIWYRVVKDAYGNKLPFGRLWDEVLGFARFVASWNSPSGRKGELIQTHYFASRFGVKIQISGSLPQVDFYLLPTLKELTNPNNPLGDFKAFSNLASFVKKFAQKFLGSVNVEGLLLSKFNNPSGEKLDTEGLMKLINQLSLSHEEHNAAIECFNAFNKGPQRTLISIMLLNDLRYCDFDPASISSHQIGKIYTSMSRTYHAPKSIAIYAQQCFANKDAMPVDTWVETFMKWPLSIYPHKRGEKIDRVFSESHGLGKVERLIWIAAQARKVHSSACNDALWCLKNNTKDSAAENNREESESREKKKTSRGANPLACNICLDSIRNVCPSFSRIRNKSISFNGREFGSEFSIFTSERNNTAHGQAFYECVGPSLYGNVKDYTSPVDDPDGFESYPSSKHKGEVITVEEFVNTY